MSTWYSTTGTLGTSTTDIVWYFRIEIFDNGKLV